MKKFVVAAACLAAALVPATGHARPYHDLPDGADCRHTEQVTVRTYAASSDGHTSAEPDRLAICIHEGGHTIFYFGGDMQSEDPRNDGFGGTCGALIVADTTVASGKYGDDWSNSQFDC